MANRLRNDKEARDILGKQIEHLLIDEFQDTNPLQWFLLEAFLEIAHFYCVGDDAQSIYSVRGADFKNVHLLKERVPDSEILILDNNYRSTQEISDISNWLIEDSPLDYKKHLVASRGAGRVPKLINVSKSMGRGQSYFRTYFGEFH
ncbi:UvrD-helicase domain-containing protein [Gelidibacter pelagius]|uniref:UvrD-helicase domain-containing protein n=1 Tax=Gelidibacter pelagius TaxID=2819985 RepID=UPI00293D46FA|nr:UvrD-helicase domain-containing protein [Gelidibacter pelagius]